MARLVILWVCAALLAACQIPDAPTALTEGTPAAGDAVMINAAPPNLTPMPDAVTLTPPVELPALAPNINPLTGLAVDDPSVLDRRPVVVKISNAPPLVRPQSGIGAADVVYEHYVEGGLTRFSAVFYSQLPARAGSIRSARLIDYELVPMYQGLLAYSGSSVGVGEYLQGSNFWERTYMGIHYGLPYYWRDETIEVPHNMFVNVQALSDLATDEGLNARPTLIGNPFSEAAPAGGEAGTFADIRYRASRVQWRYDEAQGAYLRTSDGLPHYDATTEQQISAANVILLYANHRLTDIVESQWGDSISYSIEIELWFEGDAVILRDGQRYPVRWQRPTRESLITYWTPDGQPFPLRPGNTWVQVFPPPAAQDAAEEAVSFEQSG